MTETNVGGNVAGSAYSGTSEQIGDRTVNTTGPDQVSQTVYLGNLTRDDKLDLIVARILGDPLRGTPSLVHDIEEIKRLVRIILNDQAKAKEEAQQTKEEAQQRNVRLSRLTTIVGWLVIAVILLAVVQFLIVLWFVVPLLAGT